MGFTLPSCLVFSHQSAFPDNGPLNRLREFLNNYAEIQLLRDTINDLSPIWSDFADRNPDQWVGSTEESLEFLQRWLSPEHERRTLSPPNELPYAVALPMTVLSQAALYLSFLKQIGNDRAQRHVLDGVRQAGVQGLCVGFLTAIPVALSTSESEIMAYVTTSVRLAFLIGAIVDANCSPTQDSSDVTCFVLRWNTRSTTRAHIDAKIHNYKSAYVSCINDDSSLTVTALTSDATELMTDLQAYGVRIKELDIHGRFHYHDHSESVSKLLSFIETMADLQFPTASALKVPLWSSSTGAKIQTGPLHEVAIRDILVQPAEWHATIAAAVLGSGGNGHTILSVGFANNIPSSLRHKNDVNIIYVKEVREVYDICRDHSTASSADSHFTPNTINLQKPLSLGEEYPPNAIAVVGMACRFPGADSVNDFWKLLLSNTSMVQPVPQDRINLTGQRIADRSDMKWWGNFLNSPDSFDHRFFKKSSREVLNWDPAKRLMLEVTYEALESSGFFGVGSKDQPKDYGCYIGAVGNNYYDNVSCHPPTAYSMLGTSRAFFSGRISHQFGFTGPAMTIDTACSSSLVAVDAACKAIRNGDCSRAVAGGTNVFTSPFDYENLAAAGFLSPTGGCKPFDATADGYCRGEGVAAVVLKSLDCAIAENDHILGVIVGSAVNQNYNEAHITVPCALSQSEVYRRIIQQARAVPEDFTYVEAHGTGTQVGDPIECQSIRDAFGGPQRDSRLYFGSVKGNIGHTEASAGVAGLIKILLMFQNNQIPAQAGYSRLNPKIPDLELDQMEIATETRTWTQSSKLACVNSYGAAGSNVAVALRQGPHLTEDLPLITRASSAPLFIAASSSSSLMAYCQSLLSYLRSPASRELTVSEILFNLADKSNHSLPHILTSTITDHQELLDTLEAAETKATVQECGTDDANPVILVFGGQERDYVGLSYEVYYTSRILRQHLDECNSIFQSLGYGSIYPAIFETSAIDNLILLHTALFSVQYASARCWIDSGLEPRAVIGHSFGQLTAFCISGCLSLHDAIRLVTGRASLMLQTWGAETGSMISLHVPQDEAVEILETINAQPECDYLESACFNGPRNVVAVGSFKAIDFAKTYIDDNIGPGKAKVLDVTHGFHSKYTDPLLPGLDALAKSLSWTKPIIPIETCTEHDSTDEPQADIAVDHTRKPVFFQPAIERLARKHPSATWLEAGSGSSVMKLVKSAISSEVMKNHLVLASPLSEGNLKGSLADVTVELWKAGHQVQFWSFHRSQKRQYRHIPLPGYQFEKNKHWLPYIEKASHPTTDLAPVWAAERKHEFITYAQQQNTNPQQSCFLVDPASERYSMLLNGHVNSGQPLAPVSLYIELLSRATLLLRPDASYETHVSRIETMEMKAPVGLDKTKDIFIEMTSLEGTQDSWSFIILSRTKESQQNGVVHTTGTVYLDKRTEPALGDKFKQWSNLIGIKRVKGIVENEDAEKMQGKHIYQAISQLIHFDPMYQGIKVISCVDHEAAGKVKARVNPSLSPLDLYDTPVVDGLMQFAGILVNYFTHPSKDDIRVCLGIKGIHTGPEFDISAQEWLVYAMITEDTKERVECDVYAFDSKLQKVVIAFTGFWFVKLQTSILTKSLRDVNGRATEPASSNASLSPSVAPTLPKTPLSKLISPSLAAQDLKDPHMTANKDEEVMDLLHRVTDVPLNEVDRTSTLEDLGIDSLMVNEVLKDIQTEFGLDIDLNEFLSLSDVDAVCSFISTALGVSEHDPISKTPAALDLGVDNQIPSMSAKTLPSSDGCPPLDDVHQRFEDIQFEYDRFAAETGAVGFWEHCMPEQSALVLAYVVEAFAKLGCDLNAIDIGRALPRIDVLEKHEKLVQQLYHIIRDGGLAQEDSEGRLIRTKKQINPTPSNELFAAILPDFPQHANVHRLTHVVGSEFAACLTGEKDGLQLIFGNKENKQILDDVYENWPLVRCGSLVLAEFLGKALTNSRQQGNFRILEVGAGTGGTTKCIVNYLQQNNIPYEYTFTDISSSLVASARRNFKNIPQMEFRTLDIEKEIPAEYIGQYHIIISTNCIHATRNLELSCGHLRRMLRPDGVLTLVEMTTNMYWLDIAVGLFEGWWLFEDGRNHAITSETLWNKHMRAAGFKDVAWTSGEEPEANTVRLIAGFNSARSQSS